MVLKEGMDPGQQYLIHMQVCVFEATKVLLGHAMLA